MIEGVQLRISVAASEPLNLRCARSFMLGALAFQPCAWPRRLVRPDLGSLLHSQLQVARDTNHIFTRVIIRHGVIACDDPVLSFFCNSSRPPTVKEVGAK